jgi:hypothetical protein
MRHLTVPPRGERPLRPSNYCRAVHKQALCTITVLTLLVFRSELCAEPSLGDTIEEFASAWEGPTQHERLVRTARLTWDWREGRLKSIKPEFLRSK